MSLWQSMSSARGEGAAILAQESAAAYQAGQEQTAGLQAMPTVLATPCLASSSLLQAVGKLFGSARLMSMEMRAPRSACLHHVACVWLGHLTLALLAGLNLRGSVCGRVSWSSSWTSSHVGVTLLYARALTLCFSFPSLDAMNADTLATSWSWLHQILAALQRSTSSKQLLQILSYSL